MQTILAMRALFVASAVLLAAAVPAFAQGKATVQTDDPPPTAGDPASPTEEIKPEAQRPAVAARDSDTHESLCLIVESAAKANDLPLGFFARVI